MRLLILIIVAAVLVDAYFYSGAYTRAAYRQVSLAADQFVSLIGDAVKIEPDRESSAQTWRL